jgi:hypothetical protein
MPACYTHFIQCHVSSDVQGVLGERKTAERDPSSFTVFGIYLIKVHAGFVVKEIDNYVRAKFYSPPNSWRVHGIVGKVCK